MVIDLESIVITRSKRVYLSYIAKNLINMIFRYQNVCGMHISDLFR